MPPVCTCGKKPIVEPFADCNDCYESKKRKIREEYLNLRIKWMEETNSINQYKKFKNDITSKCMME